MQLIHVYFAFLLAVSMFQLNGSSILQTGQTLSSSLHLQQRHESSLDDRLKSSTSSNEVKPLLSSAMQPAAPVGDALSIQKVCMLTFFSSAGLDATIELSYLTFLSSFLDDCSYKLQLVLHQCCPLFPLVLFVHHEELPLPVIFSFFFLTSSSK